MEVVTKLESWLKEEVKFFMFSSKFKEYLELHSQEEWVKVMKDGLKWKLIQKTNEHST